MSGVYKKGERTGVYKKADLDAMRALNKARRMQLRSRLQPASSSQSDRTRKTTAERRQQCKTEQKRVCNLTSGHRDKKRQRMYRSKSTEVGMCRRKLLKGIDGAHHSYCNKKRGNSVSMRRNPRKSTRKAKSGSKRIKAKVTTTLAPSS